MLCRILLVDPCTETELPTQFRNLIVSHQIGFLGDPETVLLSADDAGQPRPSPPLRTVQDQHTESAEFVLHYLTRHAIPLG